MAVCASVYQLVSAQRPTGSHARPSPLSPSQAPALSVTALSEGVGADGMISMQQLHDGVSALSVPRPVAPPPSPLTPTAARNSTRLVFGTADHSVVPSEYIYKLILIDMVVSAT